MLDKSGINTILRIIALGCSVILMYSEGTALERIWITVLVCLCVFAILYFIELNHNENYSNSSYADRKILKYSEISIQLICIGIIILLGMVCLSPVFVIFLVQLVAGMKYSYSYVMGAVLTAMYMLLFVDSLYITVIDFTLLSVGIIICICIGKIKYYKDMSLEQRQHISQLEEKMQNNDKLVKSIRYAAALEERNRLAVRLHDKIGHNVSGSIIMLEAAMLNMEKHPDKAVESINTAVDNLRTGVDDLRQALREERPVRSDINGNDIEILLNEAGTKHNLNTFYHTEGNLELITSMMWECLSSVC